MHRATSTSHLTHPSSSVEWPQSPQLVAVLVPAAHCMQRDASLCAALHGLKDRSAFSEPQPGFFLRPEGSGRNPPKGGRGYPWDPKKGSKKISQIKGSKKACATPSLGADPPTHPPPSLGGISLALKRSLAPTLRKPAAETAAEGGRDKSSQTKQANTWQGGAINGNQRERQGQVRQKKRKK